MIDDAMQAPPKRPSVAQLQALDLRQLIEAVAARVERRAALRGKGEAAREGFLASMAAGRDDAQKRDNHPANPDSD